MNTEWYLEGLSRDTNKTWRTALSALPFRIGRDPESDLCLASRGISQHHAEIQMNADELVLIDLGSTNGTFVNEHRIERHPLHEGDALRIAEWEFRLIRQPHHLHRRCSTTFTMPKVSRDDLVAARQQARRIKLLLREERVLTVFQPVVRLADGAVYGYEALGRGRLNGTEIQPLDLFAIAEPMGLAAELSALFRSRGLDEAAELPGDPVIFFNVHAHELDGGDELIASLERLLPGRPYRVAMEIDETAVTDLKQLIALRDRLARLSSSIAFDDFGTGQARLFELADVGPRYLKFDRAWISDLHHTSSRRREMIGTLIKLVRGLGIVTIAEGVEQHAELEACRELGFELAQGFLFGRPSPASCFAETTAPIEPYIA